MNTFPEFAAAREANLLVAFSDLTRFARFANDQPLAELFELLSDYYELAGDIVEGAGGRVIKFIGDAIVVVFGAFGNQDGHARKAIDSALALDRYAQDFAAAQHKKGLAFGITRIGVNTGSAIIETLYGTSSCQAVEGAR